MYRTPSERNNKKGGEYENEILDLHELEQILKEIRHHQLLIGSRDLLNRLNVPAVFYRMDKMFLEVQKQEEFVGLILETAQANLRQEQLQEMGHLFLYEIFNTKLIENLMNEHIAKIRSDPHKRVPPASKIAEHFCGLLGILQCSLNKYEIMILYLKMIYPKNEIKTKIILYDKIQSNEFSFFGVLQGHHFQIIIFLLFKFQ